MTVDEPCVIVAVMAVKRFWSGGRRRFLAKTLSTVGLLLMGALFTSDVLEKFSVVLRGLISLTAVGAVVGAVLTWSDEAGSSEEG